MLGRVRVTANDSTHTIVTLRTASRQVEGVSQPENNPDEHDQWQDIQREQRCREAQAGEVVADCTRDGGHHEGDQRDQQDQYAENWSTNVRKHVKALFIKTQSENGRSNVDHDVDDDESNRPNDGQPGIGQDSINLDSRLAIGYAKSKISSRSILDDKDKEDDEQHSKERLGNDRDVRAAIPGVGPPKDVR